MLPQQVEHGQAVWVLRGGLLEVGFEEGRLDVEQFVEQLFADQPIVERDVKHLIIRLQRERVDLLRLQHHA